MVAHFVLHLVKLVVHLLATHLIESLLSADDWVIDKMKTWGLDLILLILDDIGQISFLPGILLVVLLALLD